MMRNFVLPCVSLLFILVACGTSLAQIGGTDTGGGDTGGGDTALSSDFDTGASLERSERQGRDTDVFVGAAAPTTGDFAAANDTSNPLGGAGGRGGQNPFFNFFNQVNRANQQFNQQNQQNQLRIPLRLGFAKPPRPATQPVMTRDLTTAMQSRFNRLDRFGPEVKVTLDGNTAVLSGLVADEDSRKLAARLVMLEPGVTGVRNELQVVAVRTEPAPLP